MRFRTTPASRRGRNTSRIVILRRSRPWTTMRCCGLHAPIARRLSKNVTLSFRGALKARTRNLDVATHLGIPGLRQEAHPGMTQARQSDRINPTMNLHHLLNARRAAGKPVRVALIGAGKFGSMFLAQVPHTPGLEGPVIVDLDPQRAREACRTVAWDDARIAATTFPADGSKVPRWGIG